MAAEGKVSKEITPDDNPYEFAWPDDAKELRAAERAAKLKKADVKPAPRWLTAYLIGVITALTFEAAAAFILRSPEMMTSLGVVTVAIGVPALVIGAVMNLLTKNWRPGFTGPTFLAVGAALGFVWTYLLTGFIYDRWGNVSPTDMPEAQAFREAASLFMFTTTGAAFYLARTTTDLARNYPKAVFAAGVVVLAVAAWSTFGLFAGN